MIDLGYQDGEETRRWEILKDIDRRKAVELYPDFDVAYLRAAYITPSIDDHEMAEIELLQTGLERSIRKSEILARLCCWHCWNTHANDVAFGSAAAAVRFGVQALAAGDPPRGPGSKLQAYQLITELMRYLDRRLSDDLYWKGPRIKLGERQQREVRYTADSCVRSFPLVAQDALAAVRQAVVPKL